MVDGGPNPYGLTYTLGLQGQGTPRANPKGGGLEGFIAIGRELGARTLEIYEPWLAALSDDALAALRARLGDHGMTPIVSSGLQSADIESCIRSAHLIGAGLIRFALTPILCGDRNAAGGPRGGVGATRRATARPHRPHAGRSAL